MNIFILSISLIFAAGKVQPVKTLEITGNLVKIAGTNIVTSLNEVTSVQHEIPLINPNLAKTQEEKEWVSLTNLEAKWLTGKRYVFLKGEKVEVTLAQEVEILRSHARRKAGLPEMPMTEDERTYLDLQLKAIQAAVDKKIQSDRYSNRFRAEMIKTTVEAENAVAKATTKASGNIFILVLDGIPYFLGNLKENVVAEYSNMEFRVKSDLGLSCNLPTTPPSNNKLKLKLDNYYGTVNHISYNLSNSMFITDTVENTAFCNVTGTGDRIFASGFEAQGQQ